MKKLVNVMLGTLIVGSMALMAENTRLAKITVLDSVAPRADHYIQFGQELNRVEKITVKNTSKGARPLTIYEINLEGDPYYGFRIVKNTCEIENGEIGSYIRPEPYPPSREFVTLEPGEKCIVKVKYDPSLVAEGAACAVPSMLTVHSDGKKPEINVLLEAGKSNLRVTAATTSRMMAAGLRTPPPVIVNIYNEGPTVRDILYAEVFTPYGNIYGPDDIFTVDTDANGLVSACGDLPRVLNPYEGCSVAITFHPRNVGYYHAEVFKTWGYLGLYAESVGAEPNECAIKEVNGMIDATSSSAWFGKMEAHDQIID